MNIKLDYLLLENFKGVKSFRADINSDNTIVKAANGVGKTTLFDSFIFLLFGKSSDGRKTFNVRPLDSNNAPINGLVVAVEAGLIIDGELVILRKEHREKLIKGQVVGFETYCWINEVPNKVGEYDSYISGLIPEETFKMLSDLHYFNDKIHWTDRRKMLLQIAGGDIRRPEGFERLLDKAGNRKLDDYKKVLNEQKKTHNAELESVNARIDERQRSLDSYAGVTDKGGLMANRTAVQDEIKTLESQKTNLYAQEGERQKVQHEVDMLRRALIARESELNNDTSSVQVLLDEKRDLMLTLATVSSNARQAMTDLAEIQNELDKKQNELNRELVSLDEIRAEYTKVSKQEDNCTCAYCKQVLPEEQIEAYKQQKADKLAEITKRGNVINAAVKQLRSEIDEIAKRQIGQNATYEAQVAASNEEKAKIDARITEIDQAINNRDKVKPEDDHKWLGMKQEIETLEAKIGESTYEQTKAIDEQLHMKRSELNDLNKALSQYDRRIEDEARIKELEESEKVLAQKIAECDAMLDLIMQYKAKESTIIENAVNGRFKHVNFKLFKENLNGSIEDDCIVTFQGVPYNELSTGQKIMVGIDVVNVLSDHFNASVPLFIDNAESFTLPLEANCQTIELYALKSARTLTLVQKEKKEVANV